MATTPTTMKATMAPIAPPEIPLDEEPLLLDALFPAAGVGVAAGVVDALVDVLRGALVDALIGALVTGTLVTGVLVDMVLVGIGVVEENVDDVGDEVEVGAVEDVDASTKFVVIAAVAVE